MRLALILLAAALLTGCTTDREVVRHIVASGPPTTTPAPRVTLPAITGPPTTARPTARSRTPRASRGTPRSGSPISPAPSGIWGALANCEASRGQDSANGRYHGFFQFSLATWRSVGEKGDPHTHPYEVQLAAAQRLQARSGWGQWPRCARHLGLI